MDLGVRLVEANSTHRLCGRNLSVMFSMLFAVFNKHYTISCRCRFASYPCTSCRICCSKNYVCIHENLTFTEEDNRKGLQQWSHVSGSRCQQSWIMSLVRLAACAGHACSDSGLYFSTQSSAGEFGGTRCVRWPCMQRL